MTTGPDHAPQPALPEVVLQTTIDTIATQLHDMCDGLPELPELGRAHSFSGELDGEPVIFLAQTFPQKDAGNKFGRLLVYPQEAVGDLTEVHYTFVSTHGSATDLVKGRPVDETRFRFDEPQPSYDRPALPFHLPGEEPDPAEQARYKERLLRAQATSGYLGWALRRESAWRRFIYDQRQEERRLGLNITYEPEAQEILAELRRATTELYP
jgi:hypothetical protein